MEFVKAASVGDVRPGAMKEVNVGGKSVCLANVGGSFYAIGNQCTHARGPLCDGDLEGSTVTCPLHGATFDVTTGQVKGPPARQNVPKYEVKVQGNDVLVKA